MVQPSLISQNSSVPQVLASLVAPRYQPIRLLADHGGRKTLLARDCSAGQSIAQSFRQSQINRTGSYNTGNDRADGDRLVIIKILLFHPDFDWQDFKLFEREVELLKAQNHPAIPRYLDSFEVETPRNKGFALVQQYIQARSLQDHLAAGRTFTAGELEQLTQQLLDILDYLHNQAPHIIHRDIKPSNILLSNDSVGSLRNNRSSASTHSVGQVYLIDFGSVQAIFPHSSQGQLANTMTIVGTYGYMPPEQFGGQAVPASDLYSLGATLIYLASGRQPNTLMKDGLSLDFEPYVGLDEGWIDWLSRLVASSLEQRFGSVQEARTALSNRNTHAARRRRAHSLKKPHYPSAKQPQIQFEPIHGGCILTLPSRCLKLQHDEKLRPTGLQVIDSWIQELAIIAIVGFAGGVLLFLLLGLLTQLSLIFALSTVLGIGIPLAIFILWQLLSGSLRLWLRFWHRFAQQLKSRISKSKIVFKRDRITLAGRYSTEFKRTHLWRIARRRSSYRQLVLCVQSQNIIITAKPAELDRLTPLLEKALGLEVEL